MTPVRSPTLIIALLAFGLLSVVHPAPIRAEDTISYFTLPGLSGPPSSLDQYKGKTVVLNFWASWCDSCEEEIQTLNALQKKYSGQPIVFIGINEGEDPKKVKKFVDKTKFGFEIWMDQDKQVAKQMKIFSLPQTLVVSQSGGILYHSAKPPLEVPSS